MHCIIYIAIEKNEAALIYRRDLIEPYIYAYYTRARVRRKSSWRFVMEFKARFIGGWLKNMLALWRERTPRDSRLQAPQTEWIYWPAKRPADGISMLAVYIYWRSAAARTLFFSWLLINRENGAENHACVCRLTRSYICWDEKKREKKRIAFVIADARARKTAFIRVSRTIETHLRFSSRARPIEMRLVAKPTLQTRTRMRFTRGLRAYCDSAAPSRTHLFFSIRSIGGLRFSVYTCTRERKASWNNSYPRFRSSHWLIGIQFSFVGLQ